MTEKPTNVFFLFVSFVFTAVANLVSFELTGDDSLSLRLMRNLRLSANISIIRSRAKKLLYKKFRTTFKPFLVHHDS